MTLNFLRQPLADTYHSGSLLASHFRPTGSIPGQLSHGSRVPNSFWNTCNAVWTRPQRLQKAFRPLLVNC